MLVPCDACTRCVGVHVVRLWVVLLLLHLSLSLSLSFCVPHTFSRSSSLRRMVPVQCLRLDPSFSDAHLFMAQIAASQNDFATANSALEQALAHNFQVMACVLLRLLCYSRLLIASVSALPCAGVHAYVACMGVNTGCAALSTSPAC
jgi:hypothetical protein